MKQGVFVNGRVRLLLSPGSSCYRAKRTGERKRRSVRGCIVGPDVKMLSVTIVKKGEKEIPGLTDTTVNRRLGPKRANNIRKLYGIEKSEGSDQSNTIALIKKSVVRRTFKSKKNPEAKERQKAPKVQRLITDVRLRRKKIQKEQVVKRWQKTNAAREEYKKLMDTYMTKKKADAHEAKVQRKESTKNVEKEAPKAPVQATGAKVKATVVKTKKAATK
jgi:small subunit ribosomal protein S6e